jgi:hypothetical protein
MQESVTQIGMISFYKQIRNEVGNCEHPELIAHYQHILLGLQRIIESFGPTPEYYEWLGQFSPRNISNQCTFTIDL